MSRTFLVLNNKKFTSKNLSGGLTFIELVVVISIFAIMASIVLFNFSTFSTNITSQNLAQQVALQIKQAQSDSISGKQTIGAIFSADVLGNPDGDQMYGVNFEATDVGVSGLFNITHFTYFADVNTSGQYDAGSNGSPCDLQFNECLGIINITTGDRITGLCVDEDCVNGTYTTITTGISVSFRRPFPDAIIYVVGDPQRKGSAGIRITSSKGANRLVMVSALGQISVKDIPLVQPPVTNGNGNGENNGNHGGDNNQNND